MLTEKDYCDYDTCVALEEVGMPLKTQIVRSYAKEGILTSKIYPNRPSLYEAQKWLREEKKLIVLVGFDFCPFTSEIVYNWVIVVNGNIAKKSSYTYDYYETALDEGIKEAVKLLKEEK